MRLVLAIGVAMLAANAGGQMRSGATAKGDHIAATLLCEQTALVPGKTLELGVLLKHDPHWHTYWINPGDSGLPTKLTWQMPAGYRASDVAWPVPQRFALGEIANFGYTGEILLPVNIDVPADAKVGSNVQIAVKAEWLVCQEECIPGKANLALDLPVAENSIRDVANAKAFSAAHDAQPQPTAWTGSAHLAGDSVEVTLQGADLPAADKLDAFVVERKVVANSAPRANRQGDQLMLVFAKSDYFTAAPANLDLIVRTDTRAASTTVPFVAEIHSATSP